MIFRTLNKNLTAIQGPPSLSYIVTCIDLKIYCSLNFFLKVYPVVMNIEFHSLGAESSILKLHRCLRWYQNLLFVELFLKVYPVVYNQVWMLNFIHLEPCYICLSWFTILCKLGTSFSSEMVFIWPCFEFHFVLYMV